MDILAAEGIEFICNVEVGKDISANQIMSENDAVLLALGATWPRDLPIPGQFKQNSLAFRLLLKCCTSVILARYTFPTDFSVHFLF